MDRNVEVESVVEEDDGNVFGDNSINEDSSDVDGEMKMRDEEGSESDGSIVVKKGESRRKRKVVGSSEKVEVENDGVRVRGRVLRSSVNMTSGSVQVDENRLNESVVGFKRQMEAEYFDPKELGKEVDFEKSQVMGGLNKKQKLQVEIGVSGKILDETDVEEVDESVLLIGKGQKKQMCRGRPPKMQGMKNSIGGADSSRMEPQLVRDKIVSMLMKAGWTIEYRPRQNREYLDAVYIDMQGKTHWSTTKAYFSLKTKIEKGVACDKEVSAFTTIPDEELTVLLRPASKVRSNKNMKEKNGKNACKASEENNDNTSEENKEYDKTSEENNDHISVNDTVKNTNTLKLKNSIGWADRRQSEQQLVRDQIVSMIMKAGWTIEYRPRQKNREYQDAVYIDKQGKSHWSAPKAYSSLKMKIENGVACNKEVSAFTTIPKEELRLLLRQGSKVRGDKNMKKKKKGNSACKAEMIISGVAQNKLEKEVKEKKATPMSAKKSSSIKRGPKETQKDRQGRNPCLLARSTSKGVEPRQCRFCIIEGEAETFVVGDRFRSYHAR